MKLFKATVKNRGKEKSIDVVEDDFDTAYGFVKVTYIKAKITALVFVSNTSNKRSVQIDDEVT